MNQMTFKEENGYIVCYINGKEVSRAKKSSAGASTQDVIDIINDQIKANPDLSGTEPSLTGVEFSGDKYAVPASGGSIETIDVTITNWGTMDDPVHTNLTQEQMEKLNNGALIKVIDESAEWTPTICYPCAEIAEENSVVYFTWLVNATSSSGMHMLFQYLVSVDFLNSILTAIMLPHELDTAKMHAITDTDGNYRFVEGDGTPETISGIASVFCKWSLSGSHLMLVYALTLDTGTGLPAGTDICSFELPQWILDKIYPLSSNGLVNMANAIYVPEGGSPTTKSQLLYKTATGLKITNNSGGQASATTYLRIQFDLLIDAE